MRRILYLLTLTCVAAITVEATAQQCCNRRPILRRSCCNSLAITTQTVSTNYMPVVNGCNATGCSTCWPSTTSSNCCGQASYVQPQPLTSSASTILPASSPVVASQGISSPMSAAPISASSAPVYQPSSGAVQQQYVMPTYTQTSMQISQGYASGGLAQRKAQRAAQMRLKGHLGGSLGNASYEGVGWSTVSAQHAIQNCCYWGQRPVAQIGVAQGSDGFWYACVLYR